MTYPSANFTGRVASRHVDGRHVFVEFDEPLSGPLRSYAVGVYELSGEEGLRLGTKVRGRAVLNGANVAEIDDLKPS